MDITDDFPNLKNSENDMYINLIVESYNDYNKKYYINKLMEKRGGNLIYIKLEENQDNIKKILYDLNLSGQYLKMAKYSMSYSPIDRKMDTEENIIYVLLKSKLDDLLKDKNNYLIIENIDYAEINLLSQIIQIITDNIKSKNRGNIILTYNSNNINKNIEEVLSILKTLGFKHMKFEKFNEEEVKNILNSEGYNIPDFILNYIYGETNGDIKKIFEIINKMEQGKLILDKYYVGGLTKHYLDLISNYLSENMEEKIILENLSPGEIVIIIYLTFLDEKIDEFRLMEITNLPENIFIDSLDNLLRKGLITEEGNGVIIKYRKFSEYITRIFSDFKFSDAYLKIAKIKESEGKYFDAGMNYYRSGNLDKAYELLKKVGIEEYLNNNFKKSREALEIVVNLNRDDAEILKIYANLLMDNGEWEKSINILKNYLVRFPDIPDIELKLLLAESMHKNGNYNESLNIYNRILTSTKDPEILLKTLYGIGVNLFNKNSFIGAKYFIEMSIEKAKELKDYQILARSYNIMGILFYIDLNYEEAIKYLHLSKEIEESINDVNDLISTLINLGHVYSDINIKEGINYYLEAQKLSEKFWYSHHLIPLYINNSMIYLYNFQVKEMIFILKRAYMLSVLMKDYQYSVMAIKNIFYPLIKSGLFNEAWNLLINGVNHAENLGKKIDVIELKVLSNILMLINGDNPNWENDLLLLKNTNINYYVMESEILKQWLYFYSGDTKNTVENFEKNFYLLTENIKIDKMIQIIDFVPFYLYCSFIENKFIDMNFTNIVNRIKSFKNIEDIPYLKINVDLIDLLINIEKMDYNELLKKFYENIKKFEDEGMLYQAFIYRALFGLYSVKLKNKNILLKEVREELKKFTKKGIIKVFDYLNSYEDNM